MIDMSGPISSHDPALFRVALITATYLLGICLGMIATSSSGELLPIVRMSFYIRAEPLPGILGAPVK